MPTSAEENLAGMHDLCVPLPAALGCGQGPLPPFGGRGPKGGQGDVCRLQTCRQLSTHSLRNLRKHGTNVPSNNLSLTYPSYELYILHFLITVQVFPC